MLSATARRAFTLPKPNHGLQVPSGSPIERKAPSSNGVIGEMSQCGSGSTDLLHGGYGRISSALVAVRLRIEMVSSAVGSRFAERTSAATPATTGAAAEVPPNGHRPDAPSGTCIDRPCTTSRSYRCAFALGATSVSHLP